MSKGKEYAVALLARGNVNDWTKLPRDEQEEMALDIFDAADKDGSGSVDKTELFDSLAHGTVAVPHRIIESLFETLDINGDGVITEDEWLDNFEIYLKCLRDEAGKRENNGKASSPKGPQFYRNGVRGGTTSEKTIKDVIPPAAGGLRRSDGVKARRASTSDTDAAYAASECSAASGATVSTRRLSVAGTGGAGNGMTSPISKQSDRSVVPNKKKNAHFIIGHAGLNRKADTDAFKAKLVRRRSLKALLAVFKDINVCENGTISRQEFEHYLRRKAPDLLTHAKGIYAACTAKGNKGKGVLDEDLLDFTQILRILYPAASSGDISALLKILHRPKKPKPTDWNEKVNECKDLFAFYNVSRDGWMTPDEFSDGMDRIGMDEKEADSNYAEVFPDEKCGPVNLAEFFKWYTGYPLPAEFANESVYDDDD